MIPRTTYWPSDLIETQAASLGRTVTSNGASADPLVAEDWGAVGCAVAVSEPIALGLGDAACTVPRTCAGWEG